MRCSIRCIISRWLISKAMGLRRRFIMGGSWTRTLLMGRDLRCCIIWMWGHILHMLSIMASSPREGSGCSLLRILSILHSTLRPTMESQTQLAGRNRLMNLLRLQTLLLSSAGTADLRVLLVKDLEEKLTTRKWTRPKTPITKTPKISDPTPQTQPPSSPIRDPKVLTRADPADPQQPAPTEPATRRKESEPSSNNSQKRSTRESTWRKKWKNWEWWARMPSASTRIFIIPND